MTLGDDILPKPLTKKELHQLAMNIVGEELKKSGFEFLSVNSKLQKDPQFVCLKKKNLYFVIVRAIQYPNDPNEIKDIVIEKVKDHVEKFNATLFFAGVGLANAENYELPIFKNSNYAINFKGLKKIN
tara:strand:- start:134 stop:517 length:384 start_codon:yes stop_codon:yes gene_type:complete